MKLWQLTYTVDIRFFFLSLYILICLRWLIFEGKNDLFINFILWFDVHSAKLSFDFQNMIQRRRKKKYYSREKFVLRKTENDEKGT